MRGLTVVVVGIIAGRLAATQTNSGQISGRVQDSTGGRIPGAQADLQSDLDPGKVLHAKTDADGRYVFEGLSPGVYSLNLFSPGFASLRVKSVYLSRGEHRSLPALELSIGQMCDMGGPGLEYLRFLSLPMVSGDLGGTVRVDNGGYQGRIATGAEVVLLCGDRPCRTTTSDAQGRFLFTNLPPGEYGLRVSHVNFYPQTEQGYAVQRGRELIYYPIYLERCPMENCDPALRPKKPVAICQ